MRWQAQVRKRKRATKQRLEAARLDPSGEIFHAEMRAYWAARGKVYFEGSYDEGPANEGNYLEAVRRSEKFRADPGVLDRNKYLEEFGAWEAELGPIIEAERKKLPAVREPCARLQDDDSAWFRYQERYWYWMRKAREQAIAILPPPPERYRDK